MALEAFLPHTEVVGGWGGQEDSGKGGRARSAVDYSAVTPLPCPAFKGPEAAIAKVK